jgi:hypothetical protein
MATTQTFPDAVRNELFPPRRVWIRIDKKSEEPRSVSLLFFPLGLLVVSAKRESVCVWVCHLWEESEERRDQMWDAGGRTNGQDFSGRQNRAAQDGGARGSVTWRATGCLCLHASASPA